VTQSGSREEDDILRFAVTGAEDDATRAVEARIAAGDPELARTVAALRLVRDVVTSDAREGPSPDAFAHLRALVRERHPLPPEETWLVAEARTTVQGVRGPGDGGATLYCESAEFLLSVALRGAPESGTCAVDGQLVGRNGIEMVGAAVAWIVDGFALGRATTDENGEFSFEETEGQSFALRIDNPGPVRYIVLRRPQAC